jgi:hypothetical protein
MNRFKYGVTFTFHNNVAFYKLSSVTVPGIKILTHPNNHVSGNRNLNDTEVGCLTKHQAMKADWGSVSIAIHNLDLGTRLR